MCERGREIERRSEDWTLVNDCLSSVNLKLKTTTAPVSYTHLDVYKRQVVYNMDDMSLYDRIIMCSVLIVCQLIISMKLLVIFKICLHFVDLSLITS